jgi:hypothetical protein
LPGWLSLVRPRKGNHSAGLISSTVRDPEVAGSKTPVSETPAPGTYPPREFFDVETAV